MPFTVDNKPYSVVKFVFSEPFTSGDMTKVLGILSKLLDIGKPFSFVVDTRTANVPPINASTMLISWMRENKARIKTVLLSSCVVIGNTVASNLVKNLLTAAFKIQPTVSPNLITVKYEEGEKFVEDIMKKHI